MAFRTAFSSIFSTLHDALMPKHAWHYHPVRDLRTCPCCGRQEEMIVDLVTSDWAVLQPGDDSAHAKQAVAVAREPVVDAALVTTRTEATHS